MPRGVHHEHRIKSEAVDAAGNPVDRVWASYDDEGNELDTRVEHYLVPEYMVVERQEPPVPPRRLAIRQTAWTVATAALTTGVIELLIHWH